MTTKTNEDRIRILQSKIVKTKFANNVAQSLFYRRQMVFIFIPLQILAMSATLSGLIGASIDDKISDHILHLIDGVVGALLLFVTNMGRTLNYEGASKQHELIALHMQWLLEELDMLKYDIKWERISTSKRKSEIESRGNSTMDTSSTAILMQMQNEEFHQDELNARFAKIELGYFSHSQDIQSLLPPRVALPYDKLKFRLSLILRPLNFSGSQPSHGRFSCVKGDDGKWVVDDATYHRILNYAYSELAVVLFKWCGVIIPRADKALDETLERVVKLLCSESEKIFEGGGSRSKNYYKTISRREEHIQRPTVLQSNRRDSESIFESESEITFPFHVNDGRSARIQVGENVGTFAFSLDRTSPMVPSDSDGSDGVTDV